jgi:hypothetical protein
LWALIFARTFLKCCRTNSAQSIGKIIVNGVEAA